MAPPSMRKQTSSRAMAMLIPCAFFLSIIGEDKTLNIKLGTEAGGGTSDFILVRGVSTDVDRAVKEIHTIVENAKNELIDNSYVCLFGLMVSTCD